MSDLLQVQRPRNIRSRLTVMRPSGLPEPCEQHPVRFVLPYERRVSVLPLPEVQRALGGLAAERGARLLGGEAALRCLAERRAWALPVAVFRVAAAGPQSEDVNVVVLGSEFMNKQENVMRRSFRALRHLLEVALVPTTELCRRMQEQAVPVAEGAEQADSPPDSSDEEDNLFIDCDDASNSSTTDNLVTQSTDVQKEMEVDVNSAPQTETKDADANISVKEGFGVYKCTCQDSVFERPPTRSFRKWRFKKKSSSETLDVIVHCAHKFKGSNGEILLEPIPEYQADMGASKQSEDRITSLALSLALRDANTSVLNVRLDAESGDIITSEEWSRSEFQSQYGDRSSFAAGVIYETLSQLQALVPGYYVLQHEPSHGLNALLYAPRNTGSGQQLKLVFDSTQPAEADEAKTVKTPPQLIPTLLPWHKFRKILPCTFTHYQNQLAKPKKPPPRKNTPPRAIRWPKKRGSHKKTE